MIVDQLADRITRGLESVTDTVQEALFEPVIRLGVTGPSRAGKTVFITALVHNLLNRSGMHGLRAASEGRLAAVYLQPQPDDLVPRFAYEDHLAALTRADPIWPLSTRSISELRLSFRVRPSGLLGAVRGDRRVHLDIVDYPGEWLLDLSLMDQSFAAWSESRLKTLATRTEAQDYLSTISNVDPNSKFEEADANRISTAYTAYLATARDAGYFDTTPGRFLTPGDLEDSPALTFAPIPGSGRPARGTLGREMERRFEAYKSQVVRPFFRDHFSRLDRQIVLVDPLGALSKGPAALADLENAMKATLEAFRPGKNSFLQSIVFGRRIERILFAATKADTLHSTQHQALGALTRAMMQGAIDRAAFAGADVRSMAIASLRTTNESTRDGLDLVEGFSLDREKPIATHPGSLPSSPSELLEIARSGATEWTDQEFESTDFKPRKLAMAPGESMPHMRLDQALEFLIGDYL